tara:strand:+ start:274 stop:381 length:108 start_codon:yes stop_codon:yes gene_type:complete
MPAPNDDPHGSIESVMKHKISSDGISKSPHQDEMI